MATRQFLEQDLWKWLMLKVATPFKFCFTLIYIFFVVILMTRIDGIRSFPEAKISLFSFNVCVHFLHSYVRVLSLWNFVFVDIPSFNLYILYTFFLAFSWVSLKHVFNGNIDQKVNQAGDDRRSFFTFITFSNDFNYYSFHTIFHLHNYLFNIF